LKLDNDNDDNDNSPLSHPHHTMAKLPKPPRSLPTKAALPTRRAVPLYQQQAPRIPIPRPNPNQTPEEALKKVWAARPRLSDIQRMSEEEQQSAQHQAKLWRWRQWPMIGAGTVAFGMGMYGVMLWVSLTRDDAELKDLPADLTDRFDKEAEGYDEKVDTSETLLFLTSKRKKMAQKARGHVLEVAVGTGRNIAYYNTKQCDTVTLLDSSGPMLAVAKRKWIDTHKEYFSRVFYKQQSALEPITPPYGAQGGYDTVIETMGLCSTPEPVKLLQNIEACTKEDGQILLLEHGKSHYDWLNSILDKTAPAHADMHGCWWNKDIGQIVQDSGLEVVEIKRYNFGTTWWLELKPRKGLRQAVADTVAGTAVAGTTVMGTTATGEPGRVQAAESVVTPKPWWSLWR
jgi:methyltransferase OMS1